MQDNMIMLDLQQPNTVEKGQRVPFLIYPEDCFKTMFWDLIVSICLLLTCILTPFNLAFMDTLDKLEWFVNSMYIIDGFFFIDILVNFNCAY